MHVGDHFTSGNHVIKFRRNAWSLLRQAVAGRGRGGGQPQAGSQDAPNRSARCAQPLWNFAQLHKEADQPAAWLKEVLLDVAVFNKRGANQGLWGGQARVPHGRRLTRAPAGRGGDSVQCGSV